MPQTTRKTYVTFAPLETRGETVRRSVDPRYPPVAIPRLVFQWSHPPCDLICYQSHASGSSVISHLPGVVSILLANPMFNFLKSRIFSPEKKVIIKWWCSDGTNMKKFFLHNEHQWAMTIPKEHPWPPWIHEVFFSMLFLSVSAIALCPGPSSSSQGTGGSASTRTADGRRLFWEDAEKQKSQLLAFTLPVVGLQP